jgi:protein-tyrosine phosphatase
MVCLGNICRSPMAEGILRQKAEERGLNIEVDSAGTGDYHVGEAPDDRAIATARKFGVDISGLKARQFQAEDFDRFDRIFVMDASNHRNVLALTDDAAHSGKVSLLLDAVYPGEEMEVPDPWFGNLEGFDRCFSMLETACDNVVKEIEIQTSKIS